MEYDNNQEKNNISPQNEEQYQKDQIEKDNKNKPIKEMESKEEKADEDYENKSEEFLNGISSINQMEKKNYLDISFMDEDIIELTKELKEISQKAVDENKKKRLKREEKPKKKDQPNNLNEKRKEMEAKNLKNKDYFIPLKDDPKFKEEVQIIEIEKGLEEIKEYEKNDISAINKLKFIDIKHDDVINFQDEYVQSFFKSLNFILSENSKKRLNLLYFCIKHGFHILIPGPTGTGKTYLSEAICDLMKKI